MIKRIATKKIITKFKKGNIMSHATKKVLASLVALLFIFSGCSNQDSDYRTTRLEIMALDNLPDTTAKESVTITLQGTAERDVYVNGEKRARTDDDGVARVTLDTSGADGEKRFIILIKDEQGNESDAYVVTIVKEADHVEPDTPAKTVSGLALSATALELDENGTAAVKVTATYKDGTTENVTVKSVWVVSDTSIISIENDGTLHAVQEGSSTLSARYGNVPSNSVTLHIYQVIDGHRLPPEPDPQINNSSLLGIDSNNNGVRDDVERYIVYRFQGYKDAKKERAIALQYGRAVQKLLEEGPSNVFVTERLLNQASECEWYFYYKFKDYQYRSTHNIFDSEFEDTVFNTQERIRIYYQCNAQLSGHTFSSNLEPSVDDCEVNINEILD
jgi:hypothetical protein